MVIPAEAHGYCSADTYQTGGTTTNSSRTIKSPRMHFCVEKHWGHFSAAFTSLREDFGANPLITFWLIRRPRGQSLKKRPLHIPKSWLWKINQNHSSNLVPSKRLPFFFHLLQTWQRACRRSPPAVAGLRGILRSAQLWAHFLFTYSPLQLLRRDVWVRRPGEEVTLRVWRLREAESSAF